MRYATVLKYRTHLDAATNRGLRDDIMEDWGPGTFRETLKLVRLGHWRSYETLFFT